MSAPVSTASPKYPVLIFSHGMMGGRIQNTCLIEELVSHGYIVVGIDHTYDCSFAIFPDRTICSILMTRIPIPLDLIAHPGLEIRVEDARFVASQLETLNKSDRLLSGRMDLAKLGIFGHSLGGQTAMLTIEQDNRFKAALSLDGVNRHLLQRKINQPFMLLQADRLGDPFEVHELCKQFAGPLYCVTLKKSGHANFTDLPLLTPLHWIIGLSGSIDGLRATKIVNAYVVQFFDRYLKQMAAPLLEPHETSMFPEAVVESI
jgi:predicted dienelactone hydrolase